ncbi:MULTISPECIES: hypothetical protein [unclassified Lentimonas]|uniref:hypothetical protein n=1 Tax=unclassified Lentimonas TaxID=2630993 RepID=UPI00132BC52C|nr:MULTISPECIES: hypothetical protein [unclassified Lentimonas]CAA6691166.1 Unannotated [Lentimonas sp. CC19]CAA6694724.1 Unannotated [Lentimonas sp. CC10]CAA7071547.1 Unannotated [Lentimonas sp. CC11]
MKKIILLFLALPLVAFSQSIIVEYVSKDVLTLEAKRLHLIEKQLGISRHDFKVNCDFEFSGTAEVVSLPSERVVFSSRIDGRKERQYFSSVVLTDPKFDGSLYKADIHFDWFSQRYQSENKGIQTSVTGVNKSGMDGYNRFEFPQEVESSGLKTVWVFSLKGADGSWKPAYALRIKPLSHSTE